MQETRLSDPGNGIYAMVPRERLSPGARKLRDIYDRKPHAPFYQREFGFYCLDQWKEQGMPQDMPLETLFGFDPPGKAPLHEAGWCEPEFFPWFETKVIEDRGEYELVQDHVGRHVLCFKGRRSGFMPEYVDHPVKDMKTWVVTQHVVGGYMYLRSIMGPAEVMFMFYDQPELIHDCMRAWFELADAIIARHQQHVTIDEVFFGEDICYNHGSLISPEMMKQFLLPYYQQLLTNLKHRNLDRQRHVYFQIDTDGFCDPVIPIYRELGMDVMSPFEVASGCDVLRTAQECPDLIIVGGVDKRVLAQGEQAIDDMVDRIFPAMQARGGYIPTCDHGVPEEVRYKDYLHYRKRCLEFA